MEAKMETIAGKRRTKGGSRTTTATVQRKEVERERRQHMKQLSAKLVSLIPKEHRSITDAMTLLGSLEEATAYIKKLKHRVEELHQRKRSAQVEARLRLGAGHGSGVLAPTSDVTGSELEREKARKTLVAPVVVVRQHDESSMDVVLICSTQKPIKLHEVITILEEEGAEVVNANHSVAGHRIFYTIHSRAFSSRIGIDISRVSERLKALLQ